MTDRILMPTKLYSVDEVMGILGLKRRTIQQRLRSGVLPGKKVGRDWFILGEDLINIFRAEVKE